MKMNPAGEVPVLIDEGGLLVCEQNAIVEYIEEVYLDKNMLGKSHGERAEVRRLTGWFDNKFFAEVTRNLLYEKLFKRLLGGGHPDSEAIRIGKANILHHIDYMDFLCRSRTWLAGERMTLADITAAAHISCLDYFNDMPWERSQAVKDWYAVMKSRPSFRKLLTDRISGWPPPAHYDNLDF